MGLTLNNFGTTVVTEKYLIQAVSNNVNTKKVRLRAYDTSENLLTTKVFKPDIGTTDEFSFEINSIIRDYYSFEFFDLSETNVFFNDFVWLFLVFDELDDDGTTLGAPEITQYYAYNYTINILDLPSFNLQDFNVGDTGSPTSRFLTNATFTSVYNFT